MITKLPGDLRPGDRLEAGIAGYTTVTSTRTTSVRVEVEGLLYDVPIVYVRTSAHNPGELDLSTQSWRVGPPARPARACRGR